MTSLLLLYWGCIFLMYCSQAYYPNGKLVKESGRSFMWRHTDTFMVIIIIWMTCFSFLRTSYNDTGAYIDSFRGAIGVAEGFAEGEFSNWGENPLSNLYASVLRSFTDNYHIYFFFPALALAFASVKFFKAYSVDPVLSLLIFFSMGTYISYMAALKQCIALFFLLLALPELAKKKFLRFYLLVGIACLFHSYAVIFFMLPLLTFKPWGVPTLVILAIILFLINNYDTVMNFIVETAAEFGLDMKEDEIFFDHQLSPVRVVVYMIPGILALMFRGRLFRNAGKEEMIFTNMSIISGFILMIGTVKGANLYGRMAAYFEIATAVSLPWMIHKIFTKKSAQFITILAGVLYFGYFLFEFGVTKSFGSEYSAISLLQFIIELFQ